VLGRAIPVVGELGEISRRVDAVSRHDAGHSRNQLRLVHDLDHVHLPRARMVFPSVADRQRKVGIRVRRTSGIVEQPGGQVGIVAVSAELVAGRETAVALLAAQLGAIVALRPDLPDARGSLACVPYVYALRLGGEGLIHDVGLAGREQGGGRRGACRARSSAASSCPTGGTIAICEYGSGGEHAAEGARYRERRVGMGLPYSRHSSSPFVTR